MMRTDLTAKAQIIVRRTPEDVYNAFVDPEQMSLFWLCRRDAGLRVGETVIWYVGDGPGAVEKEVRILSMEPSRKLVLEWGGNGVFTTVTWTLTPVEESAALLVIEETGFAGTDAEQLSHVLDSTGGFNQVVVALKAWLEHEAVINVVIDHVSNVTS